MIKRLLFVVSLASLVAIATWYWWVDVLPWIEQYQEWLGAMGSIVTMVAAIASVLVWVITPRKQETIEKNEPLIRAGNDVVIGTKIENNHFDK